MTSGITVELDEDIRVGLGEPAQHQPLGFQEDLHHQNPSTTPLMLCAGLAVPFMKSATGNDAL
jgi:hypothetical protein